MNKCAILDNIRENAFKDELKKLSVLSDINKRYIESGIHTPSPGTYKLIQRGPRSRWSTVKSKIGPIRKLVSGFARAI